jgi:hypothetical protein
LDSEDTPIHQVGDDGDGTPLDGSNHSPQTQRRREREIEENCVTSPLKGSIPTSSKRGKKAKNIDFSAQAMDFEKLCGTINSSIRHLADAMITAKMGDKKALWDALKEMTEWEEKILLKAYYLLDHKREAELFVVSSKEARGEWLLQWYDGQRREREAGHSQSAIQSRPHSSSAHFTLDDEDIYRRVFDH